MDMTGSWTPPGRSAGWRLVGCCSTSAFGEILVILLVCLVVFGSERLPEMARRPAA